jgi:hypothetical protein
MTGSQKPPLNATSVLLVPDCARPIYDRWLYIVENYRPKLPQVQEQNDGERAEEAVQSVYPAFFVKVW